MCHIYQENMEVGLQFIGCNVQVITLSYPSTLKVMIICKLKQIWKFFVYLLPFLRRYSLILKLLISTDTKRLVRLYQFYEYYVGLEGNKPPRLKPLLRPHHHRGEDIRSVNIGLR